jgi:predicted phage tail protein
MSLIEDAPQPVRVQLFTDANTVAGSLSVTHQWDRAGTPAGVRVEFRDPRTFSADAVFEPVGAPDYQTINLFGCTSRDVAQQHADLTMDRRQLQRLNATFMTELEGLSCLPGQRIGIQSKTMRWGAAAWVLRADGLNLYLSERMPWQGGALHTISLRDPSGKPFQMIGVTRGASDDIMVLPSAPPFAIHDAASFSEPTQLAFGTQGQEVTDWTVQRMRPQGGQVTIECINYVPAVWSRAAPHQRAG